MDKRGSMFIGVLFVVAFVALVGIPVFQVAAREAAGGLDEQRLTGAHYLAEAGLLAGQESLVGGTTPTDGSLGSGSYTVDVAYDSATEKYTIVSTGTLGETKQELSVRLRPMTLYEELVPPLDMTTFGDISLGLHGSAVIYGDVGTNSDVIPINGNAIVVDGETHTNLGLTYTLPPFPSCTPPQSPTPVDRTWAGELVNNLSDNVFETIEVNGDDDPEILNIDATATDIQIWASTFDVANGEIIISGDNDVAIYVTDELSLDGCAVILDPDYQGTLAIYYAGSSDVRLAGNSELDFEGIIYAEDANFSFRGNANFKGALITGGDKVEIGGTSDNHAVFDAAIFAPYSDVTGLGTAEVYGAIVGRTFTGGGNLTVRYDPDLNHPDPVGEIGGQSYAREYWRYGK